MQFTATSLEDIARAFDARAQSATRDAHAATTKRDAQLAYREAGTWERAAAMLRSTLLTIPAKSVESPPK